MMAGALVVVLALRGAVAAVALCALVGGVPCIVTAAVAVPHGLRWTS